MTVQKFPKHFKTVQSSDPNGVTEVYANTVTRVSIRNNITHITLSVVRPNQEDGQDEKVVSARLVMPLDTFEALVRAYGHFQAATQTSKAGSIN